MRNRFSNVYFLNQYPCLYCYIHTVKRTSHYQNIHGNKIMKFICAKCTCKVTANPISPVPVQRIPSVQAATVPLLKGGSNI